MPGRISTPDSPLRVGIIGAGPGGLAAAIELSKLPYVDFTLYEKALALREIGAGISIQRNTWRMLDEMGAAQYLDPKEYFRPADNYAITHRNGKTGELLAAHGQDGTPPEQLHARTQRATLQKALLKAVSPKHIKLQKRLVDAVQLESGEISLEFADSTKETVDLLIGADGARSIVRKFAFPDYKVFYNGSMVYRTVVTMDQISKVEGVPDTTTFWHGPHGWVYSCPLGSGVFEITSRVADPPSPEKAKVEWGQPSTLAEVTKHFEEFNPIVKNILATSNEVTEYALFSGPPLSTLITKGNIALLGDASHPVSGGFGAGAAFAMEDSYTLVRAIAWAHDHGLPVSEGLTLYDSIRTPHYFKLYGVLGGFAKTEAYLATQNFDFDTRVQYLIDNTFAERHGWMYHHDAKQVFEDAAKEAEPKSVAATA